MAHKPFDDLPRTPTGHFRLYFFAAVARVLAGLTDAYGSHEATVAHFPFLAGYRDEMVGRVPEKLDARALQTWWHHSINRWEKAAQAHLPLRALGEAAGLGHDCLTMLACVGLVEEDARFGQVFEAAQESPGQRRPNAGLLGAWWRGLTMPGAAKNRRVPSGLCKSHLSSGICCAATRRQRSHRGRATTLWMSWRNSTR